jgi:hypothetical protein
MEDVASHRESVRRNAALVGRTGDSSFDSADGTIPGDRELPLERFTPELRIRRQESAVNSSVERRALLIGINKYQHFTGNHELFGCVNDIGLIEQTLCDCFGFDKNNIRKMKNEEATRQAILDEMKKLLAATRENEIVVFMYSGHGSEMLDRERDEPTGWDQTIVPYDSGRMPHPNRDITDDEIFIWLRDLTQKTKYTTLIFDSCHSGTITRAPFGGRRKSLPKDDRPVKDLPASPIKALDQTFLKKAMKEVGPSGLLPMRDRYVLIAGCASSENSFEYPPQTMSEDMIYGALTFFLNQELVQAKPGTTYRDIVERLQNRVSAIYSEQHPQIEGVVDREIFGVRDIFPLRFVKVTKVIGNIVELAAGAAHGMTVGSNWAVYPPGTREVSHARALGHLTIVEVRGQSSDATITELADPSAIVSGARALEIEHQYTELAKRVALKPPPAGWEESWSPLKARLDRSTILHLTDESPEITIYLITPQMSENDGQPVPQLKQIAEAAWVVVDGGSSLLMQPMPVAVIGSVDRVVENLEKVSRYLVLRDHLQNPNPSNVLQDKIEFELLRRSTSGSWELVVPEAAGLPVFTSSDKLAFRVRHRHTEPLYIAVLDFGLTHRISLIFPPMGAVEPLHPNVKLEVGVRSGDELELIIPEEFPHAEGRETLKLIATRQYTEYTWLQQERMRGVMPRKISQLEKFFEAAATRGRDVQQRIPTAEEWITLERTFVLKK